MVRKKIESSPKIEAILAKLEEMERRLKEFENSNSQDHAKSKKIGK